MTPIAEAQPRANLICTVASGEALDVREFAVHERMSSLFEITLVVLSENPNIDFDVIVGRTARFAIIEEGLPRAWTGICNQLQQIAVEERGLSTYELTIVPLLWLATQRRNYRVFQQMSELDIARKLLDEWGVSADVRVASAPKKRKYRVQYGESDFTFLCRMLEDAGISFYFEQGDEGSGLCVTDAPHASVAREAKLPYRDHPSMMDRTYVTDVHIGRRLRPGRYTVRDHDYRRPAAYKLVASAAAAGVPVEERLERYHYTPGAFLVGSEKGEGTPMADDKGKSRVDEAEGALLAQRRLEAKRSSAKTCTFKTNANDLAPGVVVQLLDHPRSDLGEDKRLLIVASSRSGISYGEWSHRCEARSADVPYRPPLSTPKPRAVGVESATVVGRAGEEIHTDEFGRVRVSFHWDRESKMDDDSSCWIHVSQPWGGAGFGGINLPRVGQEVIVDFLSGDPDRPIITGRVYTNVQKVPYGLPANKTQSGWRSNSTGSTGGYNELMFEDASGRELVRMQAERDLTKLVKHDEQGTVGRNRTRLVKNDEKITIGNDREKRVERDEKIVIGQDRDKRVERDEKVVIGHDRDKRVERDEKVVIGNNRDKRVERDEKIVIGHNRDKTVEQDEKVTIGNDRSKLVKNNEKVTVGNNRSKVVKNNEEVLIGNNLTQQVVSSLREVVGLSKSVSVGLSRSTQIGAIDSTVVGQAHSVMVLLPGEGEADASACCNMTQDRIEWKTTSGAASIVMEGGTITIIAEKFDLKASKGATLDAASGDMVITGKDKVKLNPDAPPKEPAAKKAAPAAKGAGSKK